MVSEVIRHDGWEERDSNHAHHHSTASALVVSKRLISCISLSLPLNHLLSMLQRLSLNVQIVIYLKPNHATPHQLQSRHNPRPSFPFVPRCHLKAGYQTNAHIIWYISSVLWKDWDFRSIVIRKTHGQLVLVFRPTSHPERNSHIHDGQIRTTFAIGS